MKFTRGNLALRDHLKSGRRVLLFVQDARSFVRYESELEFLDFDYFLTTARDGKVRRGIKFFFKRAGASLNYPIDQVHSALWLETGGQYVPDLPNTTERSGLVTSRVGQGAYRKSILFRWEFKCAVTGYSTNEVLIASHIVPWKGAKDAERLDVNNGILLSPTYDALFDRHLISFEDNGRIILPGTFERNHYDLLGVTGREQIANFKEGNLPYLARHRVDLIKGVLE